MPCEIVNPSIESLSLPFPLGGILRPGGRVVVNYTKAQIISALGGSAAVLGTVELIDLPGFTGTTQESIYAPNLANPAGPVQDGGITTAKLAAKAVTSAKIADAAVTGGAAGSGVQIAAATITVDNVHAATLTPTQDAVAAALHGTSALGLEGTGLDIIADFTAGTPGSAGDVFITDQLPFKFRILSVSLSVTTAIAGKTVTLRDAAAGAGTALSDAMSAATDGIVAWNLTTTRPTLAANSALYLRLSDMGLAGSVHIHLMRVA